MKRQTNFARALARIATGPVTLLGLWPWMLSASPLDYRPPPPPQPLSVFAASAPGYCASQGGSTGYEAISSVSVTPNPSGT